jgi:hypothetical protein
MIYKTDRNSLDPVEEGHDVSVTWTPPVTVSATSWGVGGDRWQYQLNDKTGT